MAKSRKSRTIDEPTPLSIDDAPLPDAPADLDAQSPEASQDSAVVIDNAAEAADQQDPSLESVGEMEEEPALVIDGELAGLVSTPTGLRGAIEALLFASPDPLTLRRIGNVLDLRDSRLILATIKQLQADYDAEKRGFQIVETAEGFQMATRELFGDLILRLKGRRRRPALSPTALETVAIIAYRQPMIRAEVEAIRGVESSGTIRNLIDMGLVEMVGRKEVLGRPPMYGTTAQFLQSFGLKTLNDLPAIAELKRQYVENEREAEEAEQRSQEAVRQEEARRRLEESENFAMQRQQATEEPPAALAPTANDDDELADDDAGSIDAGPGHDDEAGQ